MWLLVDHVDLTHQVSDSCHGDLRHRDGASDVVRHKRLVLQHLEAVPSQVAALFSSYSLSRGRKVLETMSCKVASPLDSLS